MGFTPVNEVTITRSLDPREIVVKWVDVIRGDQVQERKFSYYAEAEAFMFAASEFKQREM